MEGVKKVYNDIPKSPRDDRLYRGLELNNHMKVLVISDPLTDKAAAAMDVHIGKIMILLLKFKLFLYSEASTRVAGKTSSLNAQVYLYFHVKDDSSF